MTKSHGILLTTLLLCSSVAYTQQTDYQKWRAERLQNYQSFSADYLQRYQSYKERVAQRWGNGAELPDQHSYVTYSDDLTEKTVVDFARQEIRVETLAEPSERQVTQLQRRAEQLLTKPITQIAAEDPLLQGLSLTADGSLLQALAPDLTPEQPLTDTKVSTEQIQIQLPTESRSDASKKRVQRVTIKLNGHNFYQRRAEQYRALVQEQAKAYGFDTALLLAIMQVESSFNPLAQSSIPAFGLMQIVPDSAGKDVNTRVFKRKQAPSAELLFKPQQNILFGTAYLNILDKTYLDGITDPLSRLYCTIAAYNTGAGNVAKVFHPRSEKRIGEAVSVINTLSAEQVYQRLLTDLPYDETRKYLQKVISAMPQYQL